MRADAHGKEWSRGLLIAGIIGAAFWGPLYLVVEDEFTDRWWYDFAIVFIAVSAFGSCAWLTCAIAEFLEKRRRDNPGEGNGH